MSMYHQPVSGVPTRSTTATQNIGGAYCSQFRAQLGASDHSAVLLLPVYKQRLEREEPVTRTLDT